MKSGASDATVRLFHQFMAAEGAELQDIKDAVCNMLASVLVGVPDYRTAAEAERQLDFCARDIKTAIRANWDRRKLHQLSH